MKKTQLIKKIEESGKYVKVKIAKNGEVSGMLAAENYRYRATTNTGGRRYIGNTNNINFTHFI